jgi:hypothetical protein
MNTKFKNGLIALGVTGTVAASVLVIKDIQDSATICMKTGDENCTELNITGEEWNAIEDSRKAKFEEIKTNCKTDKRCKENRVITSDISKLGEDIDQWIEDGDDVKYKK